jgi:hypothetical protein
MRFLSLSSWPRRSVSATKAQAFSKVISRAFTVVAFNEALVARRA